MKKNIVIAVLLLITVFFIADRFYNWTHLTKQEQIDKENEQAKAGPLDASNPPRIWVAADSTTFAQKEIKPTLRMENTLTPETQKYVSEKILPQLKVSAASVEAVQKISAVVSGEVKVASITLPDNSKIKVSLAEKISFKDKYASIVIEKDSTGKVLPAKYEFQSDLYKVKTKDKPVVFFWKEPKRTETLVFSNPYFKITNVEDFTRSIQPPKNIFQLQAQTSLQVGFKNPANSAFKAGVSAAFMPDAFLSPQVGVGKIWNLSDGSMDNYGQVQLNMNIFKIRK